jgi:predicted nuclease with TOPRIM domain
MKKIEDQELEKIKSFEQKIISVKQELGNIEINKDLLKNAFTTVMQEYDNLRKELEEKYGKVNINISDGSYEEIEKNEQSN